MFLEVFQIEWLGSHRLGNGQTIWEFHAAVYFPHSKDPSRNQALTLDENHHSQSEAGSGVGPQCVKIMTFTTQFSI